jgi:uridine kinase
MAFTLHYLGNEATFDQALAIKTLLPDNHPFIAARVNHRLRELDYEVYFDATIEFLTIHDQDATRIYETSLRYLIAMSLHHLNPDYRFRFAYSISRSIFLQFLNPDIIPATILPQLEQTMRHFVQQNLPFKRLIMTNEEAAHIYQERHMIDKLEILPYRPEKTVHFYACESYMNYMYGHMVLGTRWLHTWQLMPYKDGILIQYPRSETHGTIPPFEDAPMYSQTLMEAHEWSKITKADSISAINSYIKHDQVVDFINLCEARHNRMLVELGEAIYVKRDQIRLICIAGPSSSGKTTFANRLRIELLSRGLNPIRISIDDYYLPKDAAPKDEFGQPDLENIHALDLPLFNRDLANLLAGETVTLPQSKFDTQRPPSTLTLGENTMLIIEGIHALNDALTAKVAKNQKYKIFISPQSQVSIDDHNPLSLTDMRLLRRMVRDKKYRNSPAELTIDMWPSVRRGEFKWIYQTQEEANYVFNSFLPYELCVMKRYALPVLSRIDKDAKHFPTAERLIRMLKYFLDIDEKWIPSNSLIREFIGGSCFREVED